MPSITINVDQATYDLVHVIDRSYLRKGVPGQVEHLLNERIAKDYERDVGGRYYLRGELQNFAG